MLPEETLENIEKDNVIIFRYRVYPDEEYTYAINRVVQARYNEHKCKYITQDSVLIKSGYLIDYSNIVKVCDTKSNIYLLFSYLENLELELKRAKELKNEYRNKLSTPISPREDFNNGILDDALSDYISSHDDLIKDVKHKIDRELNLLKKQ